MITYEDIINAQANLVEHWEEDGKAVIAACLRETPYNKSFKLFLNECTACGGNWGGMLLTGVKSLYPNVYDAIPDEMGAFAFSCICDTLLLLGVEPLE